MDFDPRTTCPSQNTQSVISFFFNRASQPPKSAALLFSDFVCNDRCIHAYGSAPPLDLSSSTRPNLKISPTAHRSGDPILCSVPLLATLFPFDSIVSPKRQSQL